MYFANNKIYHIFRTSCTISVLRPTKFDVRASVHHSIIHKENPTKMQQCIKILFHIYMKLNMFRATYRLSSWA